MSTNGVVHTAYTLPNAAELAAEGKNLISWQQVIEKCGFECNIVRQEDILNWTKYLKGGGKFVKSKKGVMVEGSLLYKKSIAGAWAGKGSKDGDDKWLHSKQHLIELGMWDRHMAADVAPEQEAIAGCARTSETWSFDDHSIIKLWREKGDKKRGTFRIDESNIREARAAMARNLDSNNNNLPTRKYLSLFLLDVLKIHDLWLNAKDCGYGEELILVYPKLTAAQKIQHTKLVASRLKKNVQDGFAM